MARISRQRLLAHTADIGLACFASDRPTLFAGAARGLLALWQCSPAPRPLERRTVCVAGDDDGELLVAWLNELVYQLECRHFICAALCVDAVTATELRATLHGEVYDPERHDCARQVKAATYHRLLVRQRHGRWQGRVYFDL